MSRDLNKLWTQLSDTLNGIKDMDDVSVKGMSDGFETAKKGLMETMDSLID